MKSATLLYLRLQLPNNARFLDVNLQKSGFKLTEKKGDDLTSFRNFHYELPDAPDSLGLSFQLMPNKETTQTVTISLSPEIESKQVYQLFNSLKKLVKVISFELLDLEARNKVYKKLHQQGLVNEFYVGLDEGEQLVVEQQAYIPLDADLFFTTKNNGITGGERAPDLDA